MGFFASDELMALSPAAKFFWWCLWLGLIVLTVALLILIRTRWGQSRPLRKCALLSVWAHVLMAGFATTIQFVGARGNPANEPAMRVLSVEGFSENQNRRLASAHSEQPWERFDTVAPRDPARVELDRPNAEVPRPEIDRQPALHEPLDAPLPTTDSSPADQQLPRPEGVEDDEIPFDTEPSEPAARIENPQPKRQEAANKLADAESPERRLREEVGPVERNDSEPADVPNPVLEPSAELPRLAELPVEAPVADALADRIDRLTPPGRQVDSAANGDRPSQAERDRSDPASNVTEANEKDSGPSDATESTDAADGVTAVHAPAELDGVSPRTDLLPLSPTDQSETARDRPTPSIYRHRVAPDRMTVAEQHGGTRETEEAVHDALSWLAANQSPGGRWDASRFGAGREQRIAGRDRQGAGIEADTGVTGLALLAFLGAGHTHLEGDYQETVNRALNFLLASQSRDGGLGGSAARYAYMYCHGMASFALSEAFAISGDERLEQPVRDAVAFSLSYQHPATGGWRYRRGELGDTSQLGWQLMALKSAELAGIPMPRTTREGMIRFLRSVESGRHGGLAAYRPGELPSRTMTAEALVCRQFLGMRRTNPAAPEAANYLLEQRPGRGPRNLYYWYYATLGLFQQQGDTWTAWNKALQQELLATQRGDGTLAGSWDPATVWGGYGGRVYSTALATLCFEVYYRYLPLYTETARAE